MKKIHLAGLGIAAATCLAYCNSLAGPFVFDDPGSIPNNPSIRHLWPLWQALRPPAAGGLTVEGRPVLNLSLALNYAAGHTAVFGYHAVNLAIHVCAALALFGIVRRTWRGTNAVAAGAAVALIWALHPLQTEAVTYVVQRAESLMGLFYLLTLYCFIRGAPLSSPTSSDGLVAEASRAFGNGSGVGPKALEAFATQAFGGGGTGERRFWLYLSGCFCWLGMATKEVMVSAPLIVLLYDRAFVAGAFRAALAARRGYYAVLFSSWALLAGLIASNHGRSGTVGFRIGVPPSHYIFSQASVIAHYLRLAFWPSPLVFDYGIAWNAASPSSIFGALLVVALVVGTLIALWRKPALGLLGFWFFAILAPTSLIPGGRQLLAEHRMYLALAPVVVLGVGAAAWAWGAANAPGGRAPLFGLTLAFVAGLGFLTYRRNADYSTDRGLWTDTVAKWPLNPFSHNYLGGVLAGQGDYGGAAAQFEAALKLKPDYAEIEDNWGSMLLTQRRFDEAVAHLRRSVAMRPEFVDAQNNLGNALIHGGRFAEAIPCYRTAIRIEPDFADAHNDLANALMATGQTEEALQEYQQAIRYQPDYADAYYNYGNALTAAERLPAAIAAYEKALALKPNYPEAEYNLGIVLGNSGQVRAAIPHFERALQLRPDYPAARRDLELARQVQ